MSKTMAQLPYHYGVKVRVFPSTAQKRLIKRNSDASRFIYNEMNGMNRELFLLRQVKTPIMVVQKRIQTLEQRLKSPSTAISNIHGWLNDGDLDSDMKANSIKNYRAAWNLFRKVHRSGTPVFHKKQIEQKYQTSNHYTSKKDVPSMTNGSVRLIDVKTLQVAKLGRMRFKGMPEKLYASRDCIRIGTTTITMDATGRYYVSMQLASEQPFVTKPEKKTHDSVGIDLNTDNFLTDSDGNVVANPRYYRSIKGKLAKAQRKLSRRALRAKREHRPLHDAKNYQKQHAIVASIQRKVANRRNNFLHLVSTTLIKNHDLVVAEELRSKNMLRNHALAMSIADVGWRTLLGMLTYKADLYGRKFVTVNPHNTTQTCSQCGYLMHDDEKLTLKDREWTCPLCGSHHIRDWNAAKNILAKGLVSA
ncbi:IS200/IS605 family element transposase accessory protein TnpB [Secundilactobacillus kimchicus]|uniref:RNA-guided endonuclease InsQ/TnpB family protein n=1 Tax=Secundilactobacillus kimchicus TaxID=528209 RepID=UPI001C02AF1B|nr:RNA-guided endonuclease TnpB family protein [Secundilactobacillus kimchicus]MBT9670565.1 IS200/IS605 family element transposase accessory protein TnpB [Secundilactobacillus kimchicus]